MLKKTVSYTDFNGDKQTDIFYFNLSKPELIEMEVDVEGGLGAFIERIVKTEDQKALIHEFKRLLLLSYGHKSEDGKRFMKSDDIRAELEQHAAYETLYIELATDDKAASAFMRGILPADMQGSLDQDKPTSPPPISQTPPPLPNTNA